MAPMNLGIMSPLKARESMVCKGTSSFGLARGLEF